MPYPNTIGGALMSYPSSVDSGPIAPYLTFTANVKDYGAQGNAVGHADGAITNGAAILTSVTGTFTANDVGKTILVDGAGAAGGVLSTTIASYQSATQVTLTVNASTTVSGASYVYGTDDTTAIQNAIAAIPATGGEVFLPAGSYLITASLTISTAGLALQGVPFGTRLLYDAAVVNPAIKMADTTTRRVYLRDMRLMQTNNTSSGVAIDASYFQHAEIARVEINGYIGQNSAPLYGIKLLQNGTFDVHLLNCRINVNGVGARGVWIDTSANDNMVTNTRVLFGSSADSTSQGFYINTHSNTLVHPDVENAPGYGIYIDASGHGTTLINPYLEANNINLYYASAVQAPVVIGGTIESATTTNISDNGAVGRVELGVWPNSGSNVNSSLSLPNTSGFKVNGYNLPANNFTSEDYSYIAWTGDPATRSGATAPSAGVLLLARVNLRYTASPSTVHLNVSTAGAGGTPANCFVGLYNSAGSLIGFSADQTTNWQSTGDKAISLTAQSAGSLTNLAAGYCWVAVLVGTQFTTAVQFSVHSSQPSMINSGLSASAYRSGTSGSGLSALPTSFTPSGLAQANLMFAAIA